MSGDELDDELFLMALAEDVEHKGAPPGVIADLHHYRGARLLKGGQLEEAESLLRQALSAFRVLPGATSRHADCLALLGMLHREQNHLARSRTSLLGALRLLESIPGSDLKKAACHRQLGQIHQAVGQEAAAEDAFLKAIALFGQSDGSDREIADRKIAECRLTLGTLYTKTTRPEEAKAVLGLALEGFRRQGLVRDLATCHLELGRAQRSAGNLGEAAESCRQALALFEEIGGSERDVADCHTELGTVFWTGGRWGEAEASYRQALDLLTVLDGTTVPQAMVWLNLGNVYAAQERLADSEHSYDVALDLLGPAQEGGRLTAAQVHHNLSDLYRKAGRLTEAERATRTALALFKQSSGSKVRQAGCYLHLANVCLSSGRLEDAEQSYRSALQLFESSEGTALDQARCHIGLGVANLRAGRVGNAEASHLLALTLLEAVEGASREAAYCYLNLGHIYASQGSLEAAETALTRARELGGSTLESDWSTAFVFLRLSQSEHASDPATVDRLRHEALDFSVHALLSLERARFQFPTEAQRLAWDEHIADSGRIAFTLATAFGDARLVADLVAISRASGVLEIARDAERVDHLASGYPGQGAYGEVFDRDPPDDAGAPTLTAGVASMSELGLDSVFRRRPTPVLQMPDGRLALGRFRGETPEQSAIVLSI